MQPIHPRPHLQSAALESLQTALFRSEHLLNFALRGRVNQAALREGLDELVQLIRGVSRGPSGNGGSSPDRRVC